MRDKGISIIIGLILACPIYSQNEPEQFELRKEYLWGKNKMELRLMRNEYYARYGYIFKSQDLREYFEGQKWYQPLYENVDDKLTEKDKKNIMLILEFENHVEKDYIIETLDSSYSKIVGFSPYKADFIVHQRKIEVTYPEYGWKKIVEIISYGCDFQPTIITIEHIAEPYWSFKKHVDDIVISHYKYLMTTVYNERESYNEIYPFFSNEPIVRFDGEKCYMIKIPNSKLRLFIGCSYLDTDIKVYLSTLNEIITELTIKSNGKINSIDDKDFYITTGNTRDKSFSFNKEETKTFEMWSANKIKNREELPPFSIVIGGDVTINIPVINGCIFGKVDKYQTMIVEQNAP